MTPTPAFICPDTLQTQAEVRFLSVCSGIEAASVAWEPLGWRALAFSEIEPFPSAVLAHHYPSVPNLGDMTTLPEKIRDGVIDAPEILCGGTPCQAFSVAGLRRSLEDDRGNLSLTFCEIANAIDAVRTIRGAPASVVFWENVPGVLSTKDNAFGCFLAGLAGEDLPLEPPGGKWTDAGCVHGPARAVAWRIFDAQYFGLAQRRKRVFVVASARDRFDPAAVLFEWEGVRRDSAPSREAGQRIAASVADSAGIGQPYSVANCLTQRMYKGINTTLDEGQTPVLAHSLRAEGFDASEGGTGRGTPLVPVGAVCGGSDPITTDGSVIFPLTTRHGDQTAIAFHPTQDPISSTDGSTHALGCGSSGGQASVGVALPIDGVMQATQVRRLTPVECERLQGFPDGHTAIPWRNKPASECPDGPRYKALGNSWAVPVVRWIGTRIDRELRGELRPET